MNVGRFDVGTIAWEILPVVNVVPGFASVKMRISMCCPASGGVIVATCVVPVTNVVIPVGAIVAADAIVLGFTF
jgi:hypothetical protein